MTNPLVSLKSVALFALSLATTFSPSPVYAAEGQGVGNGGGGFFCPDPAHNELLDLYEASIPMLVTDQPIKIVRSDLSVESQANAALHRLGGMRIAYPGVRKAFDQVMKAPRGVAPKGVINFPSDAIAQISKPGCTPTGLVLYFDNKDTLIWDEASVLSLPNTDQAALWVHEAVYKYLRATHGDTSSVRARKVTALLFSDMPMAQLTPAISELIGDQEVKIKDLAKFEMQVAPYKASVKAHYDRFIQLNPDETINIEKTISSSLIKGTELISRSSISCAWSYPAGSESIFAIPTLRS